MYLQIVMRNTSVKFHCIWSSGLEEIIPDKQTDGQTNNVCLSFCLLFWKYFLSFGPKQWMGGKSKNNIPLPSPGDKKKYLYLFYGNMINKARQYGPGFSFSQFYSLHVQFLSIRMSSDMNNLSNA